MVNRGKKTVAVTDFILLGSKITVDGDCSHEIKRRLLLGRKTMTNLNSILKSRHHFADKCSYHQSYTSSSSHVQKWELDHKDGWTLKNWCFQIVVLEKPLESPLECKEIFKAVNPAAKSLQSCPTLCDPTDGSHQAPPSLGFSRQEHWSVLPFPSLMHESEKWKGSRSVVSDS